MGKPTIKLHIHLCKPKRKHRKNHGTVLWRVGPVTEQSLPGPGNDKPMQIVLTDSQQMQLGPLTFTDKRGNPAEVEAGSVQWSTTDPSIATVEPSADGTSALLKAAGPLGNCQVRVSADADLGSGSVTIEGLADVQIIAGQAAVISIGTGPVEEQP